MTKCVTRMCPRSQKFGQYCPDHATAEELTSPTDQVFRLRDAFYVIASGKVVGAWNNYGAAQAGLQTEQRRSKKREQDRKRRATAKAASASTVPPPPD